MTSEHDQVYIRRAAALEARYSAKAARALKDNAPKIQEGMDAEERLPGIEAELQNFAEGASIGSPKLLAIHYRRQLTEFDIEIEELESYYKGKYFGGEPRVVTQTKDRKKRMEKEEIPLQEVKVDGFSDAYAELTPITEQLRSTHEAIETGLVVRLGTRKEETPSQYANRRLLEDLNKYRQAGINRPAQTPPSRPPLK